MVYDYIIDKIVELLKAVGVAPEEIQQAIDAIQAGAREKLVDLLMKLDVPPEVIDFILDLLGFVP